MKIKTNIIVQSKKTLDELPAAWSANDYNNLLEIFGVEEELNPAEALEMLQMVMCDEKPEDSAYKVLEYRMGDVLTDGQIQQLSHEIQEDKLSEEYPDISLQDELFNVNQLLYKAYNGRFPNCKAMTIGFELSISPSGILENEDRQNEIILRALQPAMTGHSVIERLYDEEMAGKKVFDDADSIIWKSEMQKKGEGHYLIKIWSSEYWFDDIDDSGEFESIFQLAEEEEEIEA